MTAKRKRLPDRRPAITEVIWTDGIRVLAQAGEDTRTGRIGEIFFEAGKVGSSMNLIMADVATLISVALQYGVPVGALAKSMGRVPVEPMRPEDIDGGPRKMAPASPVGAALDWIILLDGEVAEVKA